MIIGIIGQGFVGTALKEKFKDGFVVKAYDKFNKDLSVTYSNGLVIEDTPNNSVHTLVEECNVIFICVPTPMFESGECDTRIVESVVSDVIKEAEFQDRKITIVIKSTVPPGTTDRLNDISKSVGVTFSPEFLTEANAIEDFKNQNRIILGIDYVEYIEPLMHIFTNSFPNAEIHIINSKEAEMVKYATNLFLATKVSFFNDIYAICKKLDINYENTIESTLSDPRIGKSHYMVPGPDGDFGYGGHCFPKDMNAILFLAENIKVPVPTIAGAHTTNQIRRKNRDWEKMEGRAVSKKDNKGSELKEILNSTPESNSAGIGTNHLNKK